MYCLVLIVIMCLVVSFVLHVFFPFVNCVFCICSCSACDVHYSSFWVFMCPPGWTGLDQRSYSTLGPVSAWMGDRLRVGKLSRYVTSHLGQLSLATPLWVSAMSTSLGWEGNRRSGVALAMCQRH